MFAPTTYTGSDTIFAHRTLNTNAEKSNRESIIEFIKTN